METQRLCSVLDKHLVSRTYLVGEDYTVADILVFPWFHQLRVGYKHSSSGIAAADFLSVSQYENANRWADSILARPAVARGITVCSYATMEGKPWLTKK